MPPRRLGISHNCGYGQLVRDWTPHFKTKEFFAQKGIYARLLAGRLPLNDDGEPVDHGLSINHFETGQSNQYLLAIFDDLFSKLMV